jgi:protein phosphatase
VFLICSDGLTTMVDEPFIERTLLAGGSLRTPATRSSTRPTTPAGRDNITVVLFRLEEVSASHGAEQATSTGDDALRASDVRTAVEETGSRGPGRGPRPAGDDHRAAAPAAARAAARGTAEPLAQAAHRPVDPRASSPCRSSSGRSSRCARCSSSASTSSGS